MKPEIGKIIRDGERRRDAVHVALAPVQAAEDLLAASHVGFVGNSIHLVGVTSEPIGIVDPFLRQPVVEGDWFWLFLYPDTIVDMRHVWTHPAFTAMNNKVKEALCDELS